MLSRAEKAPLYITDTSSLAARFDRRAANFAMLFNVINTPFSCDSLQSSQPDGSSTRALAEIRKAPDGQPSIEELRAVVVNVCSAYISKSKRIGNSRGADKVNCGYVGDQIKKEYPHFDFSTYPGDFSRLHGFVKSMGFVVEMHERHPYIICRFGHLSTALEMKGTLDATLQETNAAKKKALANNAGAQAPAEPVKLAEVLSAIREVIGGYEDKRINSGQLNDSLKKRFPTFDHNDFGYVKFHEFCKGVGLRVKVLRGHPWVILEGGRED